MMAARRALSGGMGGAAPIRGVPPLRPLPMIRLPLPMIRLCLRPLAAKSRAARRALSGVWERQPPAAGGKSQQKSMIGF